MNKTISYLQDMINRYKNGDKSISVNDNRINLLTLQHFQRVKDDK